MLILAHADSEAAGPALGILGWFGRFATGVGSSVVSSSLNDYIRSQRDNYRKEIMETNARMAANGGFSNTEVSTVRAVASTVFYPVGRPKPEHNICVPFFDPVKNYAAITLVEGPTVAALGMTSDMMRTRNWSESQIASSLLPRVQYSRGRGSFETGYQVPDNYKTDRGSVKVAYSNTSKTSDSGTGIVTLTALDTQNNPFFRQDFPISYHA
jgi:hypothetical protein